MRDVVIIRVEVRHAPAPLASVRLEQMCQFDDPTSPRTSRVLEERAVCRIAVITVVVGHARNLLPIREPSTMINPIDRPSE
jgi:hypothetical protein